MTRKDRALSFVFGAKAEKVDKIQFTLLSDPTRLRSLVSTNPLVHVTTEKDTGLYFIQIDLQGATLTPGAILADFAVDIDPGTAIAITDTEFMSE
jgi:hypothetical protein